MDTNQKYATHTYRFVQYVVVVDSSLAYLISSRYDDLNWMVMGEREFALIIHIDLSLHICERISSFKHNLTDGPRPCVCASASVCCVFARCWFVERACAKHSSSESPEIQYSNLAHCEYLHHEQNKSERFTLFVRCSYEPKKKPGSSGGFVAHTFCVDVCVAALLPRRMRRGEERRVAFMVLSHRSRRLYF